jgi:hypothetical protein
MGVVRKYTVAIVLRMPALFGELRRCTVFSSFNVTTPLRITLCFELLRLLCCRVHILTVAAFGSNLGDIVVDGGLPDNAILVSPSPLVFRVTNETSLAVRMCSGC